LKDILIRKVNDETYNQLREKAQASKEGALEPWLREQLEILAAGPVIKERYTIRIGGKGEIRRFGDKLTSPTFKRTTMEEMQIIQKAAEMVKRNEPNDREDAISFLLDHFDDVYETSI
jgi:hypothetical protein